MDIQPANREVARDSRDETGDEGVVPHPTESQHLHPEDRTGERRPEDAGESAADAAHQKNPQVVTVERILSRQPGGDRTAHLYGGAFAAGRAAEEVGRDRGHEHQREHPQRHPVLAVQRMDLVEDQIVAARRRLADPGVGPGDSGSGQRKQGEQPGRADLPFGRPVQRDQEEGTRQSGRDPDHNRQQGAANQPPLIHDTSATPAGRHEAASKDAPGVITMKR